MPMFADCFEQRVSNISLCLEEFLKDVDFLDTSLGPEFCI